MRACHKATDLGSFTPVHTRERGDRMSKKRNRYTRRAFLRDAVVGTGTLAMASALPSVAAAATAKAGGGGGERGGGFIGKLEGPTIIVGAAAFPKKFSEAPMLAELVKAGKLPPVEKRLPDAADLMVVKPVHDVGKYGGRWRRGFTGPGDTENGNRINSTDKLLMWDYTGSKITPCLVKAWNL